MNILFLNGGRRIELIRQFRKAMSRLDEPGNVIASDIQVLAPALYEADRFRLLPPSRSPEFLDSLLALCSEENIALIVPTIDPDLLVLSRHRQAIEAKGVKLVLGPDAAINICRDKVQLMHVLAAAGIPVPRGFSFEEAHAQPLPLFIKPRDGSSSINAFRIDTPEALDFFGGYHVPNPLIQEFMAGEEYTVDLFIDSRLRPLAAVPRRRLKVRGGEVTVARVERDAAIEDLAVRAALAVGSTGPCNVQIIRTPDRAVVIEINPRFGGGVILSCEAGAPMVEWALLTALGREPSELAANIRNGLTMLRHDDSIFI